jgi:hypothetical protein
MGLTFAAKYPCRHRGTESEGGPEQLPSCIDKWMNGVCLSRHQIELKLRSSMRDGTFTTKLALDALPAYDISFGVCSMSPAPQTIYMQFTNPGKFIPPRLIYVNMMTCHCPWCKILLKDVWAGGQYTH